MISFEVKMPVRYYETDLMGVVHHSNYIRYFECARNIMMEEMGYPVEQLAADGFFTPVISVACKYHRPAVMGDTVRAVATIENAPLAKLYVKQAVYNQNDELLADGQVVVAFTDKETGRPVRCPAKLLSIIESMLG
ncbi:MAG: acyl-CoA thioesterase [Bacteroidales bacterium]|nr:acyl-CoA thioesterase [Bacteroidales bacterium]